MASPSRPQHSPGRAQEENGSTWAHHRGGFLVPVQRLLWMTMKDTSMKSQLCLFNTEKVFSKMGQLNFLSEQGKPEKGKSYQPNNLWRWKVPSPGGTMQEGWYRGESQLPLKKCITLALRNEPEKLKTKTEWTKWLTAQAQRLGNQWRFLPDPNFDLGFTRRRSHPATPCGSPCPSRKGLGRPQELRLLLSGRGVQLYQHNHTEVGCIAKSLSWLAALCLNTNIKNDMCPAMFKTSSEAQAACSIVRCRTTTTGRSEGRQREASKHMALEVPPWPGARSVSYRQPQTPPAQQSIPRTQTHSRATVSDVETLQLTYLLDKMNTAMLM